MIGGEGPVESVRRGLRGPVRHRRAERLLLARPQDGADRDAASSELEDLPGVVTVTVNTITGSTSCSTRQSSPTTSWPQPSTIHAASAQKSCT
jgi:hypothetical protein